MLIFNNSNGIVIGNIIGSNVANIGLVLGLSLLFVPLRINKLSAEFKFNLFSLSAITLIFVLLILNNVLIMY